MKKLIIIFLLLFVSVAYGEDKTIWLEPGVSAGPVRIGDNEESVLKKLGGPDDIKGVPLMYSFSYDNFFIEMNSSNDVMRRMVNIRKGVKNEKKELGNL